MIGETNPAVDVLTIGNVILRCMYIHILARADYYQSNVVLLPIMLTAMHVPGMLLLHIHPSIEYAHDRSLADRGWWNTVIIRLRGMYRCDIVNTGTVSIPEVSHDTSITIQHTPDSSLV